MCQSTRVVMILAVGVAALGLISGAAVNAQISNNPYHVNFSWDKLQGRKIGTASGIKMDRDGKHIWILDRCGEIGRASCRERV